MQLGKEGKDGKLAVPDKRIHVGGSMWVTRDRLDRCLEIPLESGRGAIPWQLHQMEKSSTLCAAHCRVPL